MLMWIDIAVGLWHSRRDAPCRIEGGFRCAFDGISCTAVAFHLMNCFQPLGACRSSFHASKGFLILVFHDLRVAARAKRLLDLYSSGDGPSEEAGNVRFSFPTNEKGPVTLTTKYITAEVSQQVSCQSSKSLSP